MARSESMAAIDAALQKPIIKNNPENDLSVIAPRPAPGVDAPTPFTGEAEEAKNETSLETARNNAQSDIQQDANKQVLTDEQRQSIGSKTVRAASNIIKGTSSGLESIPTPGSIIFPLTILIVFFALLLPANGHTRLVWLWLTLTGNAAIDNSSQSSNSQQSAPQITQNNDVPLPANNNSSQVITLPSFLNQYPTSTMTGVEQIQ